MRPWKTLATKAVFDAKPWFRVFQDTVQLPTGRTVDDYYRIEGSEFALVIAWSDDGKVLVERQYKHGLGRVTTTFPAGFIDDGETPLSAAKRELLEETGFQARVWMTMGAFLIDGTRGYGKAHCFIAEGLDHVSDPRSDDMEELEVGFLSVPEVVDAIARGEISLLPAIAALAMATNPLFERLRTAQEA